MPLARVINAGVRKVSPPRRQRRFISEPDGNGIELRGSSAVEWPRDSDGHIALPRADPLDLAPVR